MEVKANPPPEDPAAAALRKSEQQAAEAQRLQYTQANLSADTLVRLRRFGAATAPGSTVAPGLSQFASGVGGGGATGLGLGLGGLRPGSIGNIGLTSII